MNIYPAITITNATLVLMVKVSQVENLDFLTYLGTHPIGDIGVNMTNQSFLMDHGVYPL